MTNTWDLTFSKGKTFTPMNEIFLTELLARVTSIRKGKKVLRALDLGCGTGEVVVMLAKHGVRAYGMDFSRVALQKAVETARKQRVSAWATFQYVDLERLGEHVPTMRFDLVISKLTIAFMRNKKRFLSAAHRLLSPSGVFVLITPVLLEKVTYTRHVRAISVGKKAMERLLRNEFRHCEVLQRRFFEDKGLELTYLCANR